jgi:hypothetical protein
MIPNVTQYRQELVLCTACIYLADEWVQRCVVLKDTICTFRKKFCITQFVSYNRTYFTLEITLMSSLLRTSLLNELQVSHPRRTCMVVVIFALNLTLLAKGRKTMIL